MDEATDTCEDAQPLGVEISEYRWTPREEGDSFEKPLGPVDEGGVQLRRESTSLGGGEASDSNSGDEHA